MMNSSHPSTLLSAYAALITVALGLVVYGHSARPAPARLANVRPPLVASAKTAIPVPEPSSWPALALH